MKYFASPYWRNKIFFSASSKMPATTAAEERCRTNNISTLCTFSHVWNAKIRYSIDVSSMHTFNILFFVELSLELLFSLLNFCVFLIFYSGHYDRNVNVTFNTSHSGIVDIIPTGFELKPCDGVTKIEVTILGRSSGHVEINATAHLPNTIE